MSPQNGPQKVILGFVFMCTAADQSVGSSPIGTGAALSRHPGDVGEAPAPFDMIHIRCDCPHFPTPTTPFSPGLHRDAPPPQTSSLVKSNTKAARWQRAEAVSDGGSATSPYITDNIIQRWNLLLIDIRPQHLPIPQEDTPVMSS